VTEKGKSSRTAEKGKKKEESSSSSVEVYTETSCGVHGNGGMSGVSIFKKKKRGTTARERGKGRGSRTWPIKLSSVLVGEAERRSCGDVLEGEKDLRFSFLWKGGEEGHSSRGERGKANRAPKRNRPTPPWGGRRGGRLRKVGKKDKEFFVKPLEGGKKEGQEDKLL